MDIFMQNICTKLGINVEELIAISSENSGASAKSKSFAVAYTKIDDSEMLIIKNPYKQYMHAELFVIDEQYELTMHSVQAQKKVKRNETSTVLMRRRFEKILPTLEHTGLVLKIQKALLTEVLPSLSDPRNTEMAIALCPEDLEHLPGLLYSIFHQAGRTTKLNLSALPEDVLKEIDPESYSK